MNQSHQKDEGAFVQWELKIHPHYLLDVEQKWNNCDSGSFTSVVHLLFECIIFEMNLQH